MTVMEGWAGELMVDTYLWGQLKYLKSLYVCDL